MSNLTEFLSNPDVLLLLLVLGGLGLATELVHPNVITGILGALALILAVIGLAGLPVNWLGLVLLAFGFVLLVLETQVASYGLLALGGAVAIALGAAVLFNGPTTPGAEPVSVSPAVILAISATAGLVALGLAVVAARTRRMRAPAGQLGTAVPAGTPGVVKATLDPLGTVQLAGRDVERPDARRTLRPARHPRPPRRLRSPHGDRGARRTRPARGDRRRPIDRSRDDHPGRRPALAPEVPMELVAALALLAFLLALVLVFLYLSVRVVQQYERMVVFRLGRTNEKMVRDPGLRFLIPVVDRPVKVDLRETLTEVPSQTTITKDNAPISVDFLVYWRIADPLKSVVASSASTACSWAWPSTTLRAVIGDISLDEVLSKREQINEVLRVKLDEITERWGGKVTTVEIREITPPRDVQDAMNRQLSAERTRRAVITESEGTRQAAINVAEGQKQSEILKAEGERQAAILRAEGFSQALERIFAAAHQIDEKTMALQYLDALKQLGASPSTKFLIPTEFTRLAEQIGGYVDRGMTAQPPAGGPDGA